MYAVVEEKPQEILNGYITTNKNNQQSNMNINFGFPKKEVKQKVDFINGIAAMRLTRSTEKGTKHHITFNKEAMNTMGVMFDKNTPVNVESIGVGNDGKNLLLILGVDTGANMSIYRSNEEAGFHITSKTLTDRIVKQFGTTTYDYQVDMYASNSEYTAFSITPLLVEVAPEVETLNEAFLTEETTTNN